MEKALGGLPVPLNNGRSYHSRHHHVLVGIVLFPLQLILGFLQLPQHNVHLVIQIRHFCEGSLGVGLGAGGILGTEGTAEQSKPKTPEPLSLPRAHPTPS